MNQLQEIDKPRGPVELGRVLPPGLLQFIDHMVETKFLPAAHRHSISVDADASALIDKLRSYSRLEVPKWL